MLSRVDLRGLILATAILHFLVVYVSIFCWYQQFGGEVRIESPAAITTATVNDEKSTKRPTSLSGRSTLPTTLIPGSPSSLIHGTPARI